MLLSLSTVFTYRYTLCSMCYGYIGSPKAGAYICSHEGAKRPREGWYILPLLVTRCFHSNEGRAYMVYIHDGLIFWKDSSFWWCLIMFIGQLTIGIRQQNFSLTIKDCTFVKLHIRWLYRLSCLVCHVFCGSLQITIEYDKCFITIGVMWLDIFNM